LARLIQSVTDLALRSFSADQVAAEVGAKFFDRHKSALLAGFPPWRLFSRWRKTHAKRLLIFQRSTIQFAQSDHSDLQIAFVFFSQISFSSMKHRVLSGI
jgi:hypothetical protein